MPLPTPRKGESHDDFIPRCHKAIADEYPDEDQRHAVCESQWDEKEKNAMTKESEWLKATTSGRVTGVDQEASILRGYVVAQEGPFKDERGEFNKAALKEIVRLMKAAPNGLKSKFSHPTESDDGLGKFLGRAKNPRLEKVETPRDSEGTRKEEPVWAVRADLHFDKTALELPPGGGGKPYGEYVMDLAESDPDAFSSSLQLQVEKEYRIDREGRPLKGEDDRELPPLWFPKSLHASDIVDTGDAVDGILSATEIEGLDVTLAHKGVALLDRQFKGESREQVRARCVGFLERYLDHRFGVQSEETPCAEGRHTQPSVKSAPQRIATLTVTPELIISLASCEFGVIENPLPDDVRVVDVSVNEPGEQFELVLSSSTFDVVAPGDEIPDVAPPTIEPREPAGGDPDLLRRKNSMRARERGYGVQPQRPAGVRDTKPEGLPSVNGRSPLEGHE